MTVSRLSEPARVHHATSSENENAGKLSASVPAASTKKARPKPQRRKPHQPTTKTKEKPNQKHERNSANSQRPENSAKMLSRADKGVGRS